MKYIVAALDFFFGCHHNELSRVFTIGGRSYQVCCECGAEFRYSLDTMSIQRGVPAAPAVGAVGCKQRDFSRSAPCQVLHFKSAH